MAHVPKVPITILTGFTGAGKTTLILNVLPQLRRQNPTYRLAMIKNEIGDLAVDTQLTSSAEISGSTELLGECICCVNVGQIEDALDQFYQDAEGKGRPDRIIIETSGSAEPLKLVLEINRLAKETARYYLDGVISVIDAENWSGYASTSYTAKLQAQQTDLIVINKWEEMSERDFDIFLDRLGDLDVSTPQIKSKKGDVPMEVLFGFDEGIARAWAVEEGEHEHEHEHGGEAHEHTTEVECLSVTLASPEERQGRESVDMKRLEEFLRSAPKDEVYRIKAILFSEGVPKNGDGEVVKGVGDAKRNRFILNWSFGRWTWVVSSIESRSQKEPALRMSIFTAPYESNKWTKKVEGGGLIALEGGQGKLVVKRVQ